MDIPTRERAEEIMTKNTSDWSTQLWKIDIFSLTNVYMLSKVFKGRKGELAAFIGR